MNKKGSVQDILMIAVTLFVISIVTILVYKISDEFNTQVQADNLFDAEGRSAVSNINSMFPGVVDNSFLILTVFLAIVAFVLATLVRVHPVFIVFFILILGIIILISGAFSNVYQEISGHPEFTTIADNLTFTTYIMEFLPFIVGVFGFILSMVMYKLYKVEQEF